MVNSDNSAVADRTIKFLRRWGQIQGFKIYWLTGASKIEVVL